MIGWKMRTITTRNWPAVVEELKLTLERVETDLAVIRNVLQDLADCAYEDGREEALSDKK